ncbi:MAG TPA: AMP-binding protein [Candidatus Methylomirabilis sp.]|nr:AMP-binding protein [Candidatus Methylomirabilis sp.]
MDWYEQQTLGLLPERAAKLWGDREALAFQGNRWTFAEVHARVDAAAKGLLQLGIAPGDKVALWMVNRPEWIDAMFAIMQIGAVLVPVNTRFRTEDMAYVLAQSDAVAVILGERSGPVEYLAMMREVVPGLGGRADPRFPALRHVVVLSDRAHPDTVGWRQMVEQGRRVTDDSLRERARAVAPDHDGFVLYTSGTTGFPKGAVHDHRIVQNTWDMGERMQVTVDDTILMYLPLFHAFGFIHGALMSVIRGARQVLAETFDGDECVDLIGRERATIIHGFDTHFQELLAAQAKNPRDVSSVRTGICGTGMASSIPVARRARQTFGNLMTGYGMSEIGIVTLSVLDSTDEQCVEGNGYALPGFEVRIVDPATGTDQPVTVPGEILARGYMVTPGYYKKPEDTARAIDGDGWFHTGDMGFMRPDGHLRFMGRYKDMLKIGGENVDPMEVETFLMNHPAIKVAAVVGIPDARLSEVPVAFVQLEPGARLMEREVIDHCRGRVASFKIPRHVAFLDELPMTGTGKIQKVKLRERARSEWPDAPAR